MNLENINGLLTWIVTNDDIKSKNNNHIFAYKIANNATHTETFDKFIQETNLNVNNSWYFDTATELTKMGHMIFCNIPDTNDILLFCPDTKKMSNTQIKFLSLFKEEFHNFENINIATYDEENDEFKENVINGAEFDLSKEIINEKKVLVKK